MLSTSVKHISNPVLNDWDSSGLHIYLSEIGVINVCFLSNITMKTLRECYKRVNRLVALMRAENRKVLIMVSSADPSGEPNRGVGRESVRFIRGTDFDKLAIRGDFSTNTKLINLIIMATGLSFKMKFFTNETQAISWLTD